MHHIGRIGDLSPCPSTPDWRRKVSDGGIHRMVEVPACWYHIRDRCECIFTMDHGWPTSASAGEILTHKRKGEELKEEWTVGDQWSMGESGTALDI